MTINTRIRKVREELTNSNNEFAEKLNVSSQAISNYVRDGYNIGKNVINNILEVFPQLNANWLLTGEGEMLKSDISNVRPLDNFDFMMVPIVHISAAAGYPRGAGNQEYIDQLPTMPVIVDKSYKGKYRVFEVDGDSMDDSSRKAIYDRDKLLCREIPFDMWKSKLHINDWYFVIVLRDGDVTVKQITEHNTETGIIKCHPLNPLFDDFEIDLRDVVELYNVIKIVDRDSRI